MLIGISDPLGAKADRLRCEVFQNLILIPINTGTLRHAVATALTVYGIETDLSDPTKSNVIWLQQPLPFTVLKRLTCYERNLKFCVATALTVYGIET